MIVSRVMTKNPVYVHPDSSVTETRALMDREQVGHLPVLDYDNSLAGIITREDMIKAAPSQATTLDVYELSYLLTKMKVQEIMTKKVITVTENEVVEEAARIMSDKGIGCLPVMRDDLLVGIITDTDLFNVFVKAFGGRHPGVRITLILGEHPGVLAKLGAAIAEKGGNIVSVVTTEGDDVAHIRLTMRVERISRSEVEAALASVPDAAMEDIRE
ncbi:MAG: CBS domain-containing protein [Treponema sp.]|nr:CBS domain-containing protein [Treponema sp.]